MEPLSALLALSEGNPFVTDGLFLPKGLVMWSFYVFFVCVNKLLNESSGSLFVEKTPSDGYRIPHFIPRRSY